MIFNISKRTELIMATFIGLIVIVWNKILLCPQPSGLGFDSQSFLYWDYLHKLGLIPFKDYFYPYGFLFYLKTDSVFWYIFSLGIVALVLGSVFLLFKNIFKEKLYVYTFFLSFCIFVSLFMDYDSFLRYSPMLLICYLISFFSYKRKLFDKLSGLILGLVLGFLFSFINDLFFYGLLTLATFVLAYIALIYKKLDKKIILFTVSALIGIIIGSLPLIVFLYKNAAIPGFINNYHILKEVSFFAKVPFPPALKSPENIFLIGTLIISLLSLISYFTKKSKHSLSFYLKLSLVISLLFLEQKNVIRAFNLQLIIFGFVLFLILLNDFRITLEKLRVSPKIIYINSLNMILIIFLLTFSIGGINKGNLVRVDQNNKCIDNKMSYLDKGELSRYTDVRDFINKDKDSKIFSFPGDSVFYILFNQAPPRYPSIYEASSVFAQEQLTSYIQTNKVKYVIYNTKSFAIQDGVPDRIRGHKLYDYIFMNYSSYKKIGDFQILKKK